MTDPIVLRWRLPPSAKVETAAGLVVAPYDDADLRAIVADLQLRVAALESGNTNPPINASLTQTLGTIALTGRAVAPLQASLAATLAPAALASTVQVIGGGIASLSASLDPVGFAGTAKAAIAGVLAATLAPAALVGTAIAPLGAMLAVTMAAATVASTATVATSGSINASANVTLAAVSLVATVTAPLNASVAQTLAAVALTGTAGTPRVGPIANNTMLPVGSQSLTSGGEQSLIHPVRLGTAGATCSDVRIWLARAIGYNNLLGASYTVNALYVRLNGAGSWYQVTSGGSGSFTVTSWTGAGGAGDLPYLETDVISGLTVTHGDDLESFAYVSGSAVPVWSGTNLEAMYTDEGFLETSGTTTPRRVTNPTDTSRRNRMQIITGIVGTTNAKTFAVYGDSIGAASSGNLGDGSFAGHVRGVQASTINDGGYGLLNISIGGEDPGQGGFWPELRKAYIAKVTHTIFAQGINSVYNKVKTAAESFSAMKRVLPIFNGKAAMIASMSPITTDSTGNTAKSFARSIGTTWTTDYNTLLATLSLPTVPFYELCRRDASNPTLWVASGTPDGLHTSKTLQQTIHDSTSRAGFLSVMTGTVPTAAFTQGQLTHNVQSGTATFPTQAVDGGRRYLSTASGTYKFDLPGLQPGVAHHIDFWIIVPSFGGASIDICPATTSLYLKQVNVTTAGNIKVTDGSGAGTTTVTSTATVTDGNPHHVRIVWDPGGTGGSIQIDGGTPDTVAFGTGQTTSILAYQVKATGAHLIRDLAIYRRRKNSAVSTFTPTTVLTGTETDLIALSSMNNTAAITLGPVLPQ